MDLLEDELELLMADEAIEELQDAFSAARDVADLGGNNGDGEPWQEAPPRVLDDGVAARIAQSVASALAGVVPEDAAPDADEQGPEVGEGAPAAPAPAEPWRDLGPVSPMGYVYNAELRSVLRIQRGKPKRSVTVNCYFHSSCKLLLTEDRCPDDDTLKRWCCEVPPPAPGASRDERHALAQQHMALGKGRWGGKRQ